MRSFHWLGGTLLTLVAAGAGYAQTASFSMLGLTALFGQEACAENARQAVDVPDGAPSEEAESLPAAGRCEINLLPGLVPECLRQWKEKWGLGMYREARILAAIACQLDPANVTAQHALVLAEIMQSLLADRDDCIAGLKAVTVLTSDKNDCGIKCAGVTPLDGQFTPFGQFSGVDVRVEAPSAETKVCSPHPLNNVSGSLKLKVGFDFNSGIVGSAILHACDPDICGFVKALLTNLSGQPCCCAKGSGCCPCTAQEKNAFSIRIPPTPLAVMRGVLSSGRFIECEQADVNLPAPAHSMPRSVVTAAPPSCVACPMDAFASGQLMTPALPRQPVMVPASQRSALRPVEVVAPAAKHNVHLVTPHLEAHCERLVSAGGSDHIVLEGDVQLTCQRNGQTFRIQGQRVLVHLRDGTITVDSMAGPRRPEAPTGARSAAPAFQPTAYPPPPVPCPLRTDDNRP